MRMFEDGHDPYTKLQEMEALVYHHHKEIRQLQQNINELIRAYNQQAQLVKQITEQNTELLQQLTVLRAYSTK